MAVDYGFNDKTDFVKVIKEWAAGQFHAGNRSVWDTQPQDAWMALGMLHEALLGTPLAAKLEDAAITFLESGTPDQIESLGFDYCTSPERIAHVAAVLENSKARIPRSPRGIFAVLRCIVEAAPSEPRVVAILRQEVETARDNLAGAGLASRFDPDWLVENLPRIRPPIQGQKAISWIEAMPPRLVRPILDALVAADPRYPEIVAARHLEEKLRRFPRIEETAALLRQHPAFARALDEADGSGQRQ